MCCLFTDQSALGLFAVSRTVALPITEWFLADRLARGRRVGALSVAGRLFADCVALGAGSLLTVLDWAAHLTLRLVTLDLTLGASKLLAAGRAARLLTNRLADLVADRRGTFPLTPVIQIRQRGEEGIVSEHG